MTIATTTTTTTTTEVAPVTAKQAAAWEKRGETLRIGVIKKAFEVGDWYNQGAGYGFAEKAVEILDGLYSKQSLYNMGAIANAFRPELRNDQVSFGVHKVLMALVKKDESAAVDMLDQAAAGRWSVKQAEQALRALTAGDQGDSEQGEGDQDDSDQDDSAAQNVAVNDAADIIIAHLGDLDAAQLMRVFAAIKGELAKAIEA
jgi:hypothetical protein